MERLLERRGYVHIGQRAKVRSRDGKVYYSYLYTSKDNRPLPKREMHPTADEAPSESKHTLVVICKKISVDIVRQTLVSPHVIYLASSYKSASQAIDMLTREENVYVEMLYGSDVRVDIFDRPDVPTYEVLDDQEAAEELAKEPGMHCMVERADVVARMLGLRSGQVVRVTHKDGKTAPMLRKIIASS